MLASRWRMLLFLPWLGTSAAVGAPLSRFVQAGTCQLPADPLTAGSSFEMIPQLCAQGSVGSAAQQSLGSSGLSAIATYGDAYAGLHIAHWLSLHTSVRALSLSSTLEKSATAPPKETISLEQANLRVGNAALSRVRLTVGRQTLPFGIDGRYLPPLFDQFVDRHYWEGLPYGLKATWDDHSGAFIEMALMQESPGISSQGWAVRAGYDVSALEGVRFVGSFYGEETGERRGGVGLLNTNSRGDETLLELVRLRTTPDGREDPERQIIRFALQGGFIKDRRAIVVYEDIRDYSRNGTLGYDARFSPILTLRSALTYRKSEHQSIPSLWIFTLGLEAAL